VPNGDAPLGWELATQRRARRSVSARRWRRRLALTGAVALVAVLVAGGVVLGLDAFGDDPPSRRLHAGPPLTAATIAGPEEAPPCREPLSPMDPLRLWIGGDSLAGWLGPALGQLGADTGVVAPTFDSRPSSGLWAPDFFNWPEHATEELERVDPEIVVFIIGANDATVPRSGSADWRAQYELLVNAMLDILDRDGIPVYWVGSPPLRDDRMNDGVKQINEVASGVVSQHADATYVDAYQLFADQNGEYTSELELPDGSAIRTRSSDGVHFTEDGGAILGRAVFELLDQRCGLLDQAVSGVTQPIEQAPGSGTFGNDEQPPTTSGGGTAPPPTAPPPTAPPTTVPPSTIISIPIGPGGALGPG
jgi:uncharacterized protein